MSEPLHTATIVLQEEAQAGRVLTVHKAKGLEYPIVIVADLPSDRPPASDVVVRHVTGEGWLKIGGFRPLYVALTRARDHSCCLAGRREWQ